MAGGRIGARAVRELAQTAVSADASTSTSTAASPPAAAGRQTARPAELRGLARAPSSRASSSSTGGLSRQASLPARAMARETPEAPMAVFNQAMQYVNAWRAVAEGEREREALGPEHKGLSPDRETKYACDAIVSIQTCLRALAAMPSSRDVDQREVELLQLLMVAADAGVCARHATLNALADQDAVFRAQRSGTAEAETVSGADGPRPDTIEAPEPEPAGATAPSPSERAAISPQSALEREPGKIQAWLGEFTSCRSALDQIIRRAEVCGAPQTVQSMLPSAVYDKLRCCSGMQALHGIVAAASANRFVERARQMALPDLAVRADELLAAWHKENVAMEASVDALVAHGAPDKPTQRLTPKALAGHQAVIEAYAEGLDRVGLNLCLDAAADIEMDDAGGVWRSMMDVVHAISAYKSSLLALSETAGRVRIEPGKKVPEVPLVEPSEPPAEPALSEPPAGARPAAPGGTRRKHRKHGKRPAGPSAPEPVSASVPVPADTRTVAQKQVDTLLRSCRIDRNTVAELGGDIIELAHRLGQDTRLVLSALNDRTRDAVIGAEFIRGAVDRWFGEPDRVRSAKASLRAGDSERNGRLANWLGALELVGRHMTALEADMLKRDLYPKAKHLEKLLQAKGIEFVGTPGRLPPTKDVNAVGTLFEMRIQFKPLSNRERAAPWFVHLHTDRPVTAQALSTMAFDDFKAVHLKTDRDKNKGAQWEAAMRALGYTEAKVHRAAIREELLNKLFAQAARRPRRNKGGVRPAG
ncbi:type III secretion system effector XopP [Ralstonia pseudosolanacearum]|uniref:Type III effector protein hlk1 n=1 Tax=Ralstonia solanacearum TaxID=305 RepID=A0AA92EB50_RALSL|nr:type III secretion system effector XopP [Ralstonia pseudosolanacearum]QCX48485.1 type III effector protein hlk1 [Ralstonia pseudosolanacearum]